MNRNDAPTRTVARALFTVTVLALAGAGAQAGGVAAVPASPWRIAGLSTGVHAVVFAAFAIAAVAAGGIVVLIARRPRRGKTPPEDQHQPTPVGTPLGRALALLVALAVIAAPIALLVVSLHRAPSHPGASTSPPTGASPVQPTAPTRPHPRTHDHSPGGGLPVPVLIAVAAAASLTAAAVFTRRRTGGTAAPPDDGAAQATPELTERAVARARTALSEPGSPRHAVIAAYVAMSDTLATSTADVVAALTPRRVLARASASGWVDVNAASTVVGLFEKARFSRHTVTEADRDDAKAALRLVQDGLRIGRQS